MAYRVQMLPLVTGLAISGIALYFFTKKQKKHRQPKKLKNSTVRAALRASNSNIESPAKHKSFDFEKVQKAVLYAEITQGGKFPHFVKASVGSVKYEPFEEVQKVVSYARKTETENVFYKKCVETTSVQPHFAKATIGIALEEALKLENNIIQFEEILIYNQESQQKAYQQVSLPVILEQKTPQRMDSWPILNFKFWSQLALIFISVVQIIIYFILDQLYW